jgi:hypothetical protein
VYFVDNLRVNRSTYQKAIGYVRGAEYLDTYAGAPQSRLIRLKVPVDLPDADTAANDHVGRDGKARLFFYAPDRKRMGGALRVVGDEAMETKATFYFAAAPRFVFGMEGNLTYLPFLHGDSFEWAIRFECGPVPEIEATPSPTPLPTSEPTVEACTFTPFQCFDLFEGNTALWPQDGFEADAQTSITQFTVPESYFNTTLSFSSCALANLNVPDGVYWTLSETCPTGNSGRLPDGRPQHRQHHYDGKSQWEADFFAMASVGSPGSNLTECFRHDGYAVDGLDYNSQHDQENTTMSFFFDIDAIPSFSLGLIALTDVNLTAPIDFEVVTSCPTEPSECPAIDVQCGDTVFDTIDLAESGEFRHKAVYKLDLSSAQPGDTITVSTCHSATTFDTFLSLLDDCPRGTTGATEYDVSVGVLDTNNDVEMGCHANPLASELSFSVDDYWSSSPQGAAGNSSYYALLEPFGNLENGRNGSFAFTLSCGVVVPTPAPTTFVADECVYTEVACGDSLVTNLELFSSDVTESQSSYSTNTTETAVETVYRGANTSVCILEYELDVPAPVWLRSDLEVQEVYDIEGTFEVSVETTTEIVTKTTVEVNVYETQTTTYGTSGLQLFTLNVTDSLLAYTVSFSTCSNVTNYDTHLSLYDDCPTANRFLDQVSYQAHAGNAPSDVLPPVNITLLAANDEAEKCPFADYGPSTLTYQFAVPGVYYLALERYTDGPELLEDLLGRTTAEMSVTCQLPKVEIPSVSPTAAEFDDDFPVVPPEVPEFPVDESGASCDAVDIACGDCINGSLPFLNATVVGLGEYGNETLTEYDSPLAPLWNRSWFDLYSFTVPKGFQNRSNITVIASTCHQRTTADTFMTLYDRCPMNATANASMLGANNDDEFCEDTMAGASTLSVQIVESVTYFLAVERYAFSDVVLTDPNATSVDYVLCLSCDEEIPPVLPTPCEAQEVVCGDVISGYLGWTNKSNATGYSYYDLYLLKTPVDAENVTIYVHTCSPHTTFDTYLSAYDQCPTNTTTNVTVLGANDDDATCSASSGGTDAGASGLHFMANGRREYYYLGVEKYAHAVDNLFEDGVEYPYTLTVDCAVPEEPIEPEPQCPTKQLQCNSPVRGQLGYVGLSNSSTPSYDPEETFHVYQINVTDAQFYNISLIAHTCSEQTTFVSTRAFHVLMTFVCFSKMHFLCTICFFNIECHSGTSFLCYHRTPTCRYTQRAPL